MTKIPNETRDTFIEFLQNSQHKEFQRLSKKLKIGLNPRRNRYNVNSASLSTKVKFRKATVEAVLLH